LPAGGDRTLARRPEGIAADRVRSVVQCRGLSGGGEVYPGNTGDPTTLRDQIAKVRDRFGLSRVVFVGDRGLLTSARIRQELLPVEGLDWISALRSESIRKLAEGPLQPSLFDQTDLAEISHPDFPGERLIACKNPQLAIERARKREALLQATEHELETVAAATRRAKRAFARKGPDRSARGQAARTLQGGQALRDCPSRRRPLPTSASRRRLRPRPRSTGSTCCALRSPRGPGSEDTVRAYKDLAQVERAFRCLKTVDLHVRPIHHRLEERVRAHVFLCMLAYYVEWHLRKAWAPLLFAEDDRADAARRRGSPVKPATRSASSEQKAATKKTSTGETVHHFRGLIDHLATAHPEHDPTRRRSTDLQSADHAHGSSATGVRAARDPDRDVVRTATAKCSPSPGRTATCAQTI